jgi:LAGLIDADG endonuclease
MYLGLSDVLKTAFPNSILAPRPLVLDQEIKDPNWLAGFIAAEGCFFISIFKATTKIGMQVKLKFILVQHMRDFALIDNILIKLNCGVLYKKLKSNQVHFVVTKFSDITEKIIPLFKKYWILGIKHKDFEDFSKVAEMMKNKEHLTAGGLKEILKIKNGMNRARE